MTRKKSLRPSVGFVSLGCPKNLVDSEVMMGLLDRAGARLTARPEDAEILVVNTCSFIDTAKQESVDTILEMARHKTEGRARKLIVAGCLVERYRDEIQKNIPEVDAVVGTGELESILEAARPRARAHAAPSPFNILTSATPKFAPAKNPKPARTRAAPKATTASSGPLPSRRLGQAPRPHYPPTSTTKPPRGSSPRRARRPISKSPRAATTPAASASFPTCAANSARGASSPSFAEAEALVARGVREITLIGQDTTCYGEDLGLKDGLATLLDRLARIPNLRWLRFLYAYPNRITGKPARNHRRARQYLQISRPAAAARLARCPEAHEARRRRRHLP